MVISKEIFEENLNSLINRNDGIVVGLSGGADSLCLTILLDEYAKPRGRKLIACIVDHKLRPESSDEILPIIDILRERNIEYEVHAWKHEEIKSGIERKAREARYELLIKCCKENNCKYLMTAHHALDQWETFFMRLSRGSSLKGLSSIQNTSCLKDAITLVRPLIDFSPFDIKETLMCRFGINNFVNDPSNENDMFERVRWRKSYGTLDVFYNLGIENVNESIRRLSYANDCIENMVSALMPSVFSGSHIKINLFENLHIELKIRLLDCIIKFINPTYNRIASYSLLERVASEICEKAFKATNLCGVILKKDKSKNIKIFIETERKS